MTHSAGWTVVFFALLALENRSMVAADDEIGNIPTQLTVEHAQAKYRIPIPLPNRFGYGIIPELTVSFDSSAGNGVLGLGWSIDGMSSIARCKQTYAQDGKVVGVTYTQSDRFCLDGARLVNTSGLYGADGTIYHTEVDSYRRVTSIGTGPNSFKVESNDRIMYYGNTASSSHMGVAQKKKYEWLLTSIGDYTKAKVDFSYATGKNYPYLQTISSGGMEVKFIYENRTDKRDFYHNGQILKQVGERLKRIETYVGKNLHRKLGFDYVSSKASDISVLHKVRACNGKNRCLKPVIFNYEGLEDVKSLNTPVSWLQQFTTGRGGWNTNHPRFVKDMNDDGLPDLVGFYNDGVYVALNSGGGKFSLSKKWLGGVYGFTTGGWRVANHIRDIVDINGDSLPDIIGFASDGVYISLNTGKESFSPPVRKITNFGYNEGWRTNMHPRFVKDVNGDGLPDIVGFFNSEVRVSINTGATFKPPEYWLSGQFCWTAGGWRGENPRFLEDVNGDGLPDIVGFASDGVYIGINTGHSFLPHKNWLANFGYTKGGYRVAQHPRMVVDVNGDGLADIVGFSCCGVEVSICTGSSFLPPKRWYAQFGYNHGWRVGITPRYLHDINGDGLPDVVGFASNGVHVALNKGNSFEAMKIWVSHFGTTHGFPNTGNHPRFLADVDGNGLSDIIGFAANDVLVSTNNNKHAAIIGSIDSFGNKDAITYTTHVDRDVYISSPKTDTYPNSQYNGGFRIVKQIQSDNGIGGKNISSFRYGPSRVNLQGRGVLGYEWIEVTQPQNNEINTDTFNYKFPLTGTLAKTARKVNGVLLNEKYQEFMTRNKKTASKVVQVMLRNLTVSSYELDGNLQREELTKFEEMDEFGNVHRVETTISGGGKTFTQQTLKAYHNDPASWFIGQLRSIRVIHVNGNGKRAKRRTDFYYDKKTRKLTSSVIEPDHHHSLITNYTYDLYGNMISESRQAKFPHGRLGNQIRKVNMTYDSLGVRKTSTINDLGQKESYKYDVFGNTVEMNGVNGLKTKWTYDMFDRKLSEIRPDGTQIKWIYSADVSLPNAVYRITKSETGKRTGSEIFDSLDRVIRSVSTGFKGETIHEDFVYDGMGRVKKQSLPYMVTERPVWASYEYDSIGREILFEKPINDELTQQTKKIYKGLITETYDGKDHKTVREVDVMGRVVMVTDADDGVITYEYDSIGNLKKTTDPGGNVKSFVYDQVGNKVKMTDPDMGTWEYGYNVFGELIRQVDAKKQERTEEFDTLGRIVKRSEKEGVTSWFYDTATNGKGSLAKVVGPDGFQREFTYDKFGRPEAVKTRIDNEEVFTVKTMYNFAGQIHQQVYPGNKAVYYCYSPHGHLIAVRKSACNGTEKDNYWSGYNYNANSQVTMEKSGNSILTEYKYDHQSHVTSIRSLGEYQRVVRHWEYEYDIKGNMALRKDRSPNRQTMETFSYDKLDRIVRSTLRYIDPTKRKAFTEDWQYNSIGNIVRYSGLGGWHHIYDTKKPGALREAGPNRYTYDDNGNVITRNKQEISWTSFNMPHQFDTKDGKNVSFKYDQDRTRYLKVDADNRKTVYIGKVYERVEIGKNEYQHKYFIYANGKLIAVESSTKKAGKVAGGDIRYVHLDHLGSIDTVMNEEGKVLEVLRYNPFGRRQPLNWADNRQSYSEYGQPGSRNLKRGFTGHEHLEDLDLIHMNGRVYDPVVGRFLSPDPHIQDPFDSQSMNRYSYVKNNPLTLKDPSGYFFKKIGRFFKKIFKPRVILAVAASVVTLGAATPIAAGLVASAGLTGATAAIATGAIAGAASGFAGGTVMTGSVKGGLKAAVGGAVMGGVGGYFGSSWTVERVASQSVGSGVASELTGGKFRDGMVLGAITASMRYAYNKIVRYDVTWKPGGEAVSKEQWDMPQEGANNFGTANKVLDPEGWMNEGGKVSRVMNQVPGINAVAGMHDVFQVKLDSVKLPFGDARNIFNVPGMLPAAAMTYTALLDGPTSAALVVDQKKSKRH